MKKGSKRRDWTVSEERWLTENAGKLSRREIQGHLKRSKSSVEHKASQLGLSLRHHRSQTVICPKCGKQRGSLMRDGFCRVCGVEARLAKAEADTAEAMRLLTPEDRARYKATETRLQSGKYPKPAMPDTSGMTDYMASKAMEAHSLALEDWEYGNAFRALRARQRRLERMLKKIKEN